MPGQYDNVKREIEYKKQNTARFALLYTDEPSAPGNRFSYYAGPLPLFLQDDKRTSASAGGSLITLYHFPKKTGMGKFTSTKI